MCVPQALLSDDPAMLLRESMGIASDGSHRAFPSVDVDAFLNRKRSGIPVDILEELSRFNTRHFVIAGARPKQSCFSLFHHLSNQQLILTLTCFLCVCSRPFRWRRLRVRS